MKIGGVQSSTYKQFQLRRRRQDQRWQPGLDSFLSFSALDSLLNDNGMAVEMMGSGFVGQEQVWSFMPAD
ncbi:unnamed protein product [Sphagnum troendelagicum]|uniref:Uncharacterized protein n=1 Tax=Sphagnum jensenii TaxID=128206 RepID=A0ABP0WPH3_9BRYO